MDMSKEKLTLGSLFSGSGGFELAGILAGIEPIWNSEVEPFAIRVTTKRLPFVKHYGDVSTLSGDKLEPVDIITFGSPCQDMSVAGKRDGLDGERSGLFHEAIRIVREMREATDGKYPRYIVWENVPGAFSSNHGGDFRAVLSAVCSAARGETTDIPGLKKWEKYGEIVGEGYSVAWRVLDAQFWGVPQRRARIFLVADFRSECAGDILFIPESLCWNTEASEGTWEGTAETSERGFDETGELCLIDHGGSVMDLSYGKTGTLRAETHGHLPIVMSAGFCTEHSAKSRSIGYEEEKSPTLRAGVKPAVMAVENHGADGRCRLTKNNTVPILTQRMGTGGNNVPLVLQAYGIGGYRSEGMLSSNPYAGIYEAKKSRTLDLNGGNPNCHQGGIAVVEKVYPLEGNGQRPSHFGDGWNESDVMYTLNATEKHGVAYTASKNDLMIRASEDVAGTLVASDYKDPPIVCSDPYYVVRRLTPKECARLQGFPDDWCSNLETPDPSEDEICYWMDIFETHRKAITKAKKVKTEKYVRKWLQNPYSESAEYRLWGNGVALPCVHYVMSAIKRQYEREYDKKTFETLFLAEIYPYDNNPRINDDAVRDVMESIRQCENLDPIEIDEDNVILAGHTRYKALSNLGIEKTEVIRYVGLTEEQKKKYRLLSNKTNERSEWDFEKLAKELEELDFDGYDFGFEDFEEDVEVQLVEDDPPELPEESDIQVGDMFQLGNHRLICGDSTDPAVVKRLVGDKKMHLFITDPPYNVDYEGTAGKIVNDKQKDEDFLEFLTNAFKAADSVMRPGAAFYIWHADSEGYNFRTAIKNTGWTTRQVLIWRKSSLVMGRQDYQWNHEPCAYGWKEGAAHTWTSDRKQTTVIDFPKPSKSELHPTMKPVGLFGYQINNNTNPGDCVLDLFGGNGTTMIACEQLGRSSYLAELDPKYCKVIIERWQNMTNRIAEKI